MFATVLVCSLAAVLLYLLYREPFVVVKTMPHPDDAANNAFCIWVDKRCPYSIFAQEYYESRWISNPKNIAKVIWGVLTNNHKYLKERETLGAAMSYVVSGYSSYHGPEYLKNNYGIDITEEEWRAAIEKVRPKRKDARALYNKKLR